MSSSTSSPLTPLGEESSRAALAEAFSAGSVAINPIVYAEVSVGFTHIEDLDDALPRAQFVREPLPYPAGFLAGQSVPDLPT